MVGLQPLTSQQCLPTDDDGDDDDGDGDDEDSGDCSEDVCSLWSPACDEAYFLHGLM